MKYTDEQIIKKRTAVIITLLIICFLAQIWMIYRIYGFEGRQGREFSGRKAGSGLLCRNPGKQHRNLIDETGSVEKAIYPGLSPGMAAPATGNLSRDNMIRIINQLFRYYECTGKQFKKERGA